MYNIDGWLEKNLTCYYSYYFTPRTSLEFQTWCSNKAMYKPSIGVRREERKTINKSNPSSPLAIQGGSSRKGRRFPQDTHRESLIYGGPGPLSSVYCICANRLPNLLYLGRFRIFEARANRNRFVWVAVRFTVVYYYTGQEFFNPTRPH